MLNRPRHKNIGDALSSLANVLAGPKGFLMDANVPLSVRAHLEPWPRFERFIDRRLRRDRDGDKGHCELSTEREDARAIAWLKYRGKWPGGDG